jgi:hypothetical protein
MKNTRKFRRSKQHAMLAELYALGVYPRHCCDLIEVDVDTLRKMFPIVEEMQPLQIYAGSRESLFDAGGINKAACGINFC